MPLLCLNLFYNFILKPTDFSFLKDKDPINSVSVFTLIEAGVLYDWYFSNLKMGKIIALEFILIQVILPFVIRKNIELLQMSSILSFTMKVWDRVYLELFWSYLLSPDVTKFFYSFLNTGKSWKFWQGHETTVK